MKFAVVVFACVLAAATAQVNNGQYNQKDQYQYNNNRYNNRYNNPYNNQYNNQYKNQYNPYNNNYNNYNRYQNQNYNPYKPYSSPTPFPARPAVVAEASASVAPPVASVTTSPEIKITAAPSLPAPVPAVVARISSEDRFAETVKSGNDIYPDGSYNYYFETNNGIAAQAQGVPRNFGGNPPVVPDVAQGSFSWTSPEGEVIAITYVADENGYQPTGKAIPEVSPQIARALQYIARTAPKN